MADEEQKTTGIDLSQLKGIPPQLMEVLNQLLGQKPQVEEGANGEAKALQDNYTRNKSYAKEGEYQTKLSPEEESNFTKWVQENKIPFDPKQDVQDYDMRGYWKALQEKDPKAVSAIDPNDQKTHYPDYWKTPYHQTFSNESQYATPDAPKWKGDQLVAKDGKVIFDDAAQKKEQ